MAAPPLLAAAALAIIPLLLAPGSVAADDLSVLHPASQPAASIRDLLHLVLAITGAIFLLVEGILLFCIVRYRQRRTADTAEPAQIYGSQPIEVAWTVAPLIIVFVLFLVVVRSVVEAQEGPGGENAVRVQIIGHQWWWEIVYPESGLRTANELHVPAGEAGAPRHVRLELESADVVHSFWVPRLAGKTDLVPGRKNQMWFTAEQPGQFDGQCAEFCGTQHANMKIRVRIDTADEFARWQDNELRPAVEDPAVEAGRERFLSLACVNCHSVRGTSAHGTVGPDLTHLMARQTIAAGAAANTPAGLRQWIADPDEIKPGSQMPNMHLAPHDVEVVAAYLESLR